jgi:signal peptidase I
VSFFKRNKELERAQESLRLADKVYHYRRDLLSADLVRRLVEATQALQNVVADTPKDAAALTVGADRLEALFEASGGPMTQQRGWHENIEMFVVAAILAIGIRTFFFQPFKIPTNSMYPTYNGMTWQVYGEVEESPNLWSRAIRIAVRGADHYECAASVSGELLIPLAKEGQSVRSGLRADIVKARKFFVLPVDHARYWFQVGDEAVSIVLPLEFGFDRMLKELYFDHTAINIETVPGVGKVIRTGVQVSAGKPFLNFDILSGDALFVDRFTYHFREPEVGEPFVFRTMEISGMEPENRDKYYIKRLVGEAGDVLAVNAPTLYRNGMPATGAEAFDLNARQIGEYEGYTAVGRKGLTWRGPVAEIMAEPYTVPADHFFAMGDNSDQSADSRYWGPVPKQNVIGKAFFIYWPITKHWGRAQ